MKTISILNKKGGTGKTNIAYNLAVELTKNHQVLLIDLDPQMDLTTTSNLIIATKLDILDVLYNNGGIENAAVKLRDKLKIIKGNENINQFEKDESLDDLKTQLSAVAEIFDYVIIDYPPTMIEAGIQGILASDQAIIVTQPERLAFKNIDNMIEELKVIKPSIQIRILINNVDLRRCLTKKYLSRLRSKYFNKLFSNYIPVCSAFPRSNHLKVPLRELSWWPKALTELRKVMKQL